MFLIFGYYFCSGYRRSVIYVCTFLYIMYATYDNNNHYYYYIRILKYWYILNLFYTYSFIVNNFCDFKIFEVLPNGLFFCVFECV